MPAHKVSPYRVKLRQKLDSGGRANQNDYWDLTDFAGINPGFSEYDTFLDFLEAYLRHLKKTGHRSDTAERALTVVRFKRGKGSFSQLPNRTIEAELTYGRYGRTADHTKVDVIGQDNETTPSDDRTPAARDPNTVAETRLHFLAHIPTNSSRQCFIVLHSYGRNSVKTRVYDSLNRFIQQHYNKRAETYDVQEDNKKTNEYKLMMPTVAGPDVVEALRDSKLAGIEVQKRNTNVPEYMKESTELSDQSDGNLKIKYTSSDLISDMNTTKEHLLARIQNEEYPFAELVDEDPSRINAIIEAPGDNTKKINITKDEIRMEENVPANYLRSDSVGRVHVSSIGRFARQHLNEKLNEIGAQRLNEESLLDARS